MGEKSGERDGLHARESLRMKLSSRVSGRIISSDNSRCAAGRPADGKERKRRHDRRPESASQYIRTGWIAVGETGDRTSNVSGSNGFSSKVST
ncbi:uncharacterized protein LOC124691828 isoform X2 [Lolium rigidum]|uniref:uncharacterized protein LOC124691828 isoform X2 n=1 Tax=Lolium rigidum TaxID=89674 RepID=UPI001F5C708F|nr:uncharacterized protein LOC124691828 isoform X2 [Lolium rigidum]